MLRPLHIDHLVITIMTVVTGRAEMLEQRILTGDVMNVYACLATLEHY